MAPKGTKMCLVLVLVVTLCEVVRAQSGCTSVLMGLSPCLNFVTGNSSTPSSSCCSTLSNVVQSQPQCLCSLVNNGATTLGISINQTLALTLPGACNVQTPPLNQCNAAANGPTSLANSPTSAPTSSPTDSSDIAPETPTTPSVPSTPSGTASKTVPTSGSTSEGNMLRFSFQMTISVMLIVACAFAF